MESAKSKDLALSTNLQNGSRTFPCISAKENQDRKNLQAADDHTQGEDDLGQGRKGGVIPHRSYQFQPGADISDAGDHGGEGGPKGEIVHGDDQRGASVMNI